VDGDIHLDGKAGKLAAETRAQLDAFLDRLQGSRLGIAVDVEQQIKVGHGSSCWWSINQAGRAAAP
jgi:hypothetical protein